YPRHRNLHSFPTRRSSDLNAFKFTEKGKVSLRISLAKSGWSAGHPQLDAAEKVVAFSVADTGIGIPENKRKVIFEAFQQADGTTDRKSTRLNSSHLVISYA